MVFIKKHKYIFIVGFIFLLLLILAIIGIKDMLYPNASKDKYGNRLKGIENVIITDDIVNQIKEEIRENEGVLGVEYHLSGRIINFIVEVTEEVEVTKAESFGNKIIELLTDDYKNYYDLHLFVKCNTESEIYPLIASKHKDSLNFVWSNIVLGGTNEE